MNYNLITVKLRRRQNRIDNILATTTSELTLPPALPIRGINK